MSRPPLDSSTDFRYRGQSNLTRGPDATHPYISVTVDIFQYQGSDPRSEGRFTFVMQHAGAATQINIFRPGSKPLLTFNLSRQTNWQVTGDVFCTFVDPHGVTWLLRFDNATTAAHATATVGTIISVQTRQSLACYDCSVGVTGRGISEGDRVKISYHAFSYGAYPAVAGLVGTETGASVLLQRSQFPTGCVSGMIGMVSGATRAIYVPAQYTALETGARHSQFPNQNLIVVVNLQKVKFKEEGISEPSEVDVPPTPAPAPTPTPPQKKEPEPVADTSPAAESPVESDPPKSEGEELDPDELARRKKLEKIRKTGGVASAFAVPVPASGRRMTDPVAPVAPVELAGRPVAESRPPLNPAEARLEGLERAINHKLDLLLGGAEAQRVVGGVTSLAVQVKVKQQEIDNLRKQIEEQKGLTVHATTASVEQLARELDAVKAANAALEKAANHQTARIQELQASLRESGVAAKGRARTVIRRMLDGVYGDSNELFDVRTHYSGSDVSEQLRAMLKKHASISLKDINTNGLI